MKDAGSNCISNVICQCRLLLIDHTICAEAAIPLCDFLFYCNNDAQMRCGHEGRLVRETIFLAISPDLTHIRYVAELDKM